MNFHQTLYALNIVEIWFGIADGQILSISSTQ